MVISQTGFLHVNTHLTPKDIAELARIQEGWCLSLYLPLIHQGREANQTRILLRDLDAQARRELALRGLSPREIETVLAPVERMAEMDFPRIDAQGLAVFSSRSGSAVFLLSDAPRALAEVDLRFRLEPLIPILMEEDGFFLLTLGLHAVRLWEGDRAGLREIPLNGAHVHAPRTPLLAKGEAEAYCREIDAAIRKRMRANELPLILAGANPLLAVFRKVSGCERLLPDAVIGNPESDAIGKRIHGEAWACLLEARRRELDRALSDYREGTASARTAAGITDVVPCALQGRVSHLFVRKGLAAWGIFHPETGEVIPQSEPTAQAEDMVNVACLKTLLGGGRVHVLEGAAMPRGCDIAALCRY